MKNILILNGSPRKNGTTASLIKAFTEGAASAGNDVKELYLQTMKVGGCLACESCAKNGGNCVQKDDMQQIYELYRWADVIVFASPMYWGTVSGQLKIVVDRLYAEQHRQGFFRSDGPKECVFIMTARGDYYQQAMDFYGIFTNYMGWKDWGTVLGAGKEAKAKELGASIR